jgi:hypothetical protein
MKTIYTDRCKKCDAPAMKTICSNPKCKSWNKYRKLAANCKSFERGLKSNNPIPLYCSFCDAKLSGAMGNVSDCDKCRSHITLPLKADRWYQFEDEDRIYIVHRGETGWIEQIMRAK